MIPYMIEHWYVSFLRIWQRNGILRIIWKSGVEKHSQDLFKGQEQLWKKLKNLNLILICKNSDVGQKLEKNVKSYQKLAKIGKICQKLSKVVKSCQK